MTLPADALPAVFAGQRRTWLLALLGNGVARALLAGVLVLGVRALLQPAAALWSWAPAAPWWLAIMAVGVAASAWLRQRETVDAEALAQHYIAHVRLRLFDHLTRLSPAVAQQRSRGGVLMRFIGDVQALRAWVGRGIATLLVAGSTLVLLLGLLAWLAPVLAAGVAVLSLVMALALGRLHAGLFDATALARDRQAGIAASMGDRIAALPALQMAGQAERERTRLRRQNRRLRQALQTRAEWRGRHRALVATATGGATLMMAAFAGWQVAQGAGLGQAGSVFGVAVVVGLMVGPLRDLGRVAETWVAARVARQRVRDFLAVPSLPPAGREPLPPGAAVLRVQVPVVAQRVRGPDVWVLPGRRVAVCGPSGAGKTSLLLALAGLEPLSEGAVQLDGVSLAALGPKARARAVALLSPDLPLIRGSVRENLLYHGAEPEPALLQRCLALSGLDVLLARWPQGLRTRVRDAGCNLSHGERRALQLARALMAEPAVLLIDDVHTCLPGEAEASLARLISAFPGTLIYSTQDAALAAMADDIWVLDAGRVKDAWAVRGAAAAPNEPLHH